MQKNDILTLTCDALGADMEGVCRADGMAVFVPGMLPGETAQVRIVKPQNRYAFGRLEKPAAVPSPQRRESDCPAYPRCGGCTCRHMTYEATLEAKRRQVADCFQRIGHIEVEVPPVLGMENPTGYRNKTALPVGGTADKPVMGFYAPRSHVIIPAERCPNAMPPAADISCAVLDWMRAMQQAGFTLYILSNNKHHHRVKAFAEAVQLPWQNLAKKPALGGFRKAAERLQLPPQRMAMVGDQTVTDVLGARRFGCKAILVDSTDTYLWYFWPRRLLELPFRKERA